MTTKLGMTTLYKPIYTEHAYYKVRGVNLLKWTSKNKKILLFFIIVIIIIAGVLDIKYEGLFYQLLPTSMQTFLSSLF